MTNNKEFDELKELCKDLLDGADKCSRAPHYIVQPFFGIILRHLKLINKLQLNKNLEKNYSTYPGSDMYDNTTEKQHCNICSPKNPCPDCLIKQAKNKTTHKLWQTSDKGVPSVICDSNGEVILAYCKICKSAEGCLPTNCPGRILTEEEMEQITKGELDF